tara:strand:+ start:3027 stop:5144 length:2118 start_codon:yes stop_codon:yes gene_type:complete
MGFLQDAISKLTFKVQAANVIDANTNFQWYESVLENSPKITKNRIFLEYDIVTANPPTSTANLITLTSSGGALYNIVSNDYENAGTPIYHKLTQATNGNDTTYVAYSDPADRSSDRKNNWINPSSVPVNGIPVPYYTIEIYYLVGTTYTQLQATDASSTSGLKEVGWVWNYDQGLLLLSTDAINFLKAANAGAMPDLYVRGWRYIGETGVGTGGDKYADCTTQTITVPVTTQSISLTISIGLSWQGGQSIRLTSGSNLILGTVTSYDTLSGAIVIAVTSSSGSTTTSAKWCIAIGGSGGSIELEMFDYEPDPNTGAPIGLTSLTTSLEGLQIPTNTSGGGLLATASSGNTNIIELNTIFDTQVAPATNSQAVGGISSTETASSLSTLSFTELFNKLLFPTLLPVYFRPTLTLGFKKITPGLPTGATHYQPNTSLTAELVTEFVKKDSGGIGGSILTVLNTSTPVSTVATTSGQAAALPDQFGYVNSNIPNTTNTIVAEANFNSSTPTTTQSVSDVFTSNVGWTDGAVNKDSTGQPDTRPAQVPASAQVDNPISAIAGNSYNSNQTSVQSCYPWYYFYTPGKLAVVDAVNEINSGGASSYNIVVNQKTSSGDLVIDNYTPSQGPVFTVVAYPFLQNSSAFPVKTRYFLNSLNQNVITNLFDPVVQVFINPTNAPWYQPAGNGIVYRMHISTQIQSSNITPLILKNQ